MNNPFNNTELAFALKSDKALKKSHFIFSLMGQQWMVDLGASLTKIALRIGLPIKRIVKNTIFEQFCGGTTADECMPLVTKMYQKGVSSILDYSVEGKELEEEFDKIVQRKIELIIHAADYDALTFEVIKPTAIGRFYLWQKKSAHQAFTADEQKEWQRVLDRIDLLCSTAAQYDIALLFDGEESWMQDAADELVRDMMAKYNKSKALIYNTVQCYRHDRMDYVKSLYEDAQKNNFIVGAKIVRGAYMEKERARAEAMNYPSPICADKAGTDLVFNEVMVFCLDHMQTIKTCIGTHNEQSTLKAMQILLDKNIPANTKDVWFGQLYGMSDNLTYNLANLGHNTFKILPFGPIKEVLPYLIRRAQENTSVAGQMGRELALIKEEMTRRGL